MKQFNLNSVLLAIILGLSTWTIKEVTEQGKEFAAITERVAANTRDTADLRTRVVTAEAQIVLIRLEFAQLKTNTRNTSQP